MSKHNSDSMHPSLQGLALGTVVFVLLLGAVLALKKPSTITKDRISLKGELWMTVILKRGDDQLTADSELRLRPGDQIQFQRYVDMQQEFTTPLQAGMPVDTSPEHLEQHAQLVANVQPMLNHLSSPITL